jgi:ATP-dependent Clp endopeptidase proteolytic subunit ClpP
MAPIIPPTVDHLMKTLDLKIREKYERLHLMISSPGGSVFHGLSVYNFLKGSPLEVHTYNFGSVDSIGVVMYCAGSKRFSVPHARFLIHGVKINFTGQVSFDEYQIHEFLKQVQIDQKNIARVIADNTGKSADIIEKDMHDRRTLNPNEAKDYGLVHSIQSELLPIDAEFVSINEPILKGPMPIMPQGPMPIMPQGPMPIIMPQGPQGGNFTRSIDIDVVTM